MKYTLTVDEDPETGDYMLTFPPELLEQTGWKEGTSLIWKEEGNGSWSLEELKK
jgi:hypothetical protein